MTTAPSAVLGVVLQLSDTTPISGTFDHLPGLDPVGHLALELDELSGLTLAIRSTVVAERLLDQVRAMHHGFVAVDRRRQEEQAWADRRRAGRPALRSVTMPAPVHPSLMGAVR
jgi:hypothetical protein